MGEVYAAHVLEHLGQSPRVFLAVIQELHRVMADNAVCRIVVPHPRSDFFVSDPTHVRPITPQVMLLFSKRVCRETLARGWANSPLALELNVDFELEEVSYVLEPHWEARRAAGTLAPGELDRAIHSQWNVIDEVKMTIRKVPN